MRNKRALGVVNRRANVAIRLAIACYADRKRSHGGASKFPARRSTTLVASITIQAPSMTTRVEMWNPTQRGGGSDERGRAARWPPSPAIPREQRFEPEFVDENVAAKVLGFRLAALLLKLPGCLAGGPVNSSVMHSPSKGNILSNLEESYGTQSELRRAPRRSVGVPLKHS